MKGMVILLSSKIVQLNDWLTSEDMPLHSKITEDGDHNIFHTHDFYEIFYILEGSIDHEINGTRSRLHAGDIVFTTPSDVHSFFREPGNRCKHRDIIIRPQFFQTVCHFIDEDFQHAYDKNLLPKVVRLSQERLESYENRIINVILTSSTNATFHLASAKTLCISLLNNLIEVEKKQVDNHYPMWFRELLARFHMNDFLREGLDEILSPFHFSRSYMCRAFHKYLNCTMTDYLNEVRLQQATFLLQYTDDTILSICHDIGFSSISYFNKLFKEKYGMSPNAFRKIKHTKDNKMENEFEK